MSPHYRQGWNDRIEKRTEDYGKCYLSAGGQFVANSVIARDWSVPERSDYARGWQDASAKIASLVIPETEGT